MAKRGAARTKKRLTCALVIDGARLPAIVLDLSASGFFVQTSANPPPGSEIGLEIDVPGEKQRLALTVRVVRRKVVPPRLKSVVHAGLGLQILNAPEAYFSFVAQLQENEDRAASSETTTATGTSAPPAKVRAAAKKASPGRPAAFAKRAPAAKRGAAAKELPPVKAAAPAKSPPPARTAAPRRSASRGESPAQPPAPRQERFRIRVSQIGGSRSRSLEITAASEDEARREAEAACGEGWKILACDRVAAG
jgi:hypothetical protein